MTFEESVKNLREMADMIQREETTLDQALECYEKGMKAYEECSKILNNTSQKIEVFNR